MQEAKHIAWNEVLGNPYNQPLDPRMLNPEGLEVTKMGRTIGMSKFEPAIPLVVVYDQTYVQSWLHKYVMRKLKPVTYNDLQRVVADSFKAWKEQR